MSALLSDLSGSKGPKIPNISIKKKKKMEERATEKEKNRRKKEEREERRKKQSEGEDSDGNFEGAFVSFVI